MTTTLHNIELVRHFGTVLVHGDMLTARRSAGFGIVCAAGRLWITEEGVPADFILAAGQTYIVRGDGKVVVEAVSGDAKLRVIRPRTGALIESNPAA